uniref:Autophagy-related protein 13 n=2 Tax=Macrostomum lignano TaxID=282301 RepID=A0A1I8GMV4_9PLAT
MEPSQQEDSRLVQKLIRYFIFRAIQVILQSRSSKVFRCSCKVYSPQVSLGLSLEDDPSIAVSIKSQFSSNFELRNNDSHSVEIYLCSERSPARVFLEVWTFHFSDEEADPAIKRMKTFDRLVVSLKALWSVSRVLPAYRIARRQQISDRCLLCFNIRRGSSTAGDSGPQSAAAAALGSDSRERRVVSIRTAAGQLTLTCCYRAGENLDPKQLEAALAPIEDCYDEDSKNSMTTAAPPTPPPRLSSRRCLSTTNEPSAAEEDEEDDLEEEDDSEDLEEEEEEVEEEEENNKETSNHATHSSSNSSAEQELAFQSQQQQQQLSMTDSQLAACFANADADAADAVSEADAEARRAKLVQRLKSLNLRLSMFAGCGPLANRIGAIPQQLDFFERDLADFDLLLNDILAKEDADCNSGINQSL